MILAQAVSTDTVVMAAIAALLTVVGTFAVTALRSMWTKLVSVEHRLTRIETVLRLETDFFKRKDKAA